MAVAKELISLGKRKSFLQEFSASILCQLCEVCPASLCEAELVRHLDLEGGWEDCSTEQLQVLLQLSKLYNKVGVCLEVLPYRGLFGVGRYCDTALSLPDCVSNHVLLHCILLRMVLYPLALF